MYSNDNENDSICEALLASGLNAKMGRSWLKLETSWLKAGRGGEGGWRLVG